MSKALKKIWKRLTANRKQAVTMATLLVVAAFMWGRLMLDGAPRGAKADPAKAAKTGKDGAAGQEGPVLPVRRMAVEVAFADRPGRDLFLADAALYPQKSKPQADPTPNSVPEKSEEQKRAEMLAPLKALKLSTLLLGERPQALINGQLMTVNEQPAAGFTIVRITGTSVFLKHESLDEEFELKLYSR